MAKAASVTSITASQSTAYEGDFIDFVIVVEGHNIDRVHKGDLVVEVDGKTVFNEQDYAIGDVAQQIEVPIQFKDDGGKDVCATLLDPEPIDIM